MKALVNYEIASAFCSATDIEAIPLKPYFRLAPPVSCHADMLFCILDNTVFCYYDYVIENGIYNELKNAGLSVVFVAKECKPDYPNDVSLNVLVMGKVLFCNVKHTAKEIIDYANKNGYKLINIKQGYSACSTLVIDENNAITSDVGVANALKKENKRVLLINNTDIVLNGYNCGFFGGATGVYGKNIYIFGEVDTLFNSQEIRQLINECGKEIIPISSGRVYDFGGIKLI